MLEAGLQVHDTKIESVCDGTQYSGTKIMLSTFYQSQGYTPTAWLR